MTSPPVSVRISNSWESEQDYVSSMLVAVRFFISLERSSKQLV